MLKSKFLKAWIPLVILSTIFFGTLYLTLQQSYRLTSNDPQIQVAEDLKEVLQKGTSAQEVVGLEQIDIAKSLSSFIIIFDDNGKPVASQAVLDGRIPTPPDGVFENTKKKGEHRVTWEPKKGVRIASVLVRFEGSKPGYILTGRSLREVESRISGLNLQIGIPFAASLILTLIAIIILGV